MAAVEPTPPAAAPPPTEGPGRKKLLVLVIVAVLIVAGLGVAAYVLLTAKPAGPTLARVEVTAAKTSIDQREVLTVSAKAIDTDGVDQARNASFVWSASPSAAVQISATGTDYSRQIVAIQSGTVTISARATWENVERTGSVNVTIQPLQYQVTPANTVPRVGNPIDLTVIVLRADSSLATSYRGTMNFTTADYTAVTLPPNYNFTAANNGVKTFLNGVTVTKPGTVQITVRDTLAAISATFSLLGNRPPVADFTITPDASDPRQITVNGSASSDPDGDSIISYSWTFGDGPAIATGAVVVHTYASAGAYTIQLTVADSHNETGVAQKPYAARAPPLASFIRTEMSAVGVDILVRVNASASSDPDGTIATYDWTWGDGNTSRVSVPETTHTYNSSYDGQTVTIVLVVTDNDGLTATASEVLRVSRQPLPPNAIFTVTRTKLRVDVDASASTDLNGNIATYEWDWGDTTTSGPSPSPLANHTYSGPGSYTITLTVVDTTALNGTATKKVSVASSTLDYQYYDFFKTPYGEWWDFRTAIYGDLPIRAECFNATSIADGVCTPVDPTVADYSSYPYTNWYPLPGNIRYDNPNNSPLIYAPYKFRAKGVDVGGYNLSEPVFLPVFNYSEAAGNRLDFDWRMQYMDVATMDYLRDVVLCPGVDNGTQDGFKIRSQITLTMDLQESRRIFGVVAADAAAASTWWGSNIAAGCLAQGLVETKFSNWFISMGGSAGAVGKYDVYNSFEWYYQPFYTNMTATVDPDGTTHVTIDHAAWGTEVVLARMFYWGNTSYKDNYLNSSKAAGWWGMELSWFENFAFAGSLKAAGFDFNLSTVLHYHFQLLSMPGPNGLYDRTDDIPYWTWGPLLTDYTNDASARHLLSELDRYPYPYYSYNHSTPGGKTYGLNLAYDYAPVRWDLQAGQTWHFQFPTGNVIFYDPNLTPVPANPTSNDHVPVYAQLKYNSTNPFGYGDWNVSTMTWDVYGPSATGGPDGSPGADGIPGTADDRYALGSWGSLLLVPGVSVAATSTLSASAATSGSPSLAGSPIVSVSADSGIFVAQVSIAPNARRSRD